jgi:hypothetical protein
MTRKKRRIRKHNGVYLPCGLCGEQAECEATTLFDTPVPYCIPCFQRKIETTDILDLRWFTKKERENLIYTQTKLF